VQIDRADWGSVDPADIHAETNEGGARAARMVANGRGRPSWPDRMGHRVFERSERLIRVRYLRRLRSILEAVGVEFDGDHDGVRLRKTKP
jgi:hypothetical protein